MTDDKPGGHGTRGGVSAVIDERIDALVLTEDNCADLSALLNERGISPSDVSAGAGVSANIVATLLDLPGAGTDYDSVNRIREYLVSQGVQEETLGFLREPSMAGRDVAPHHAPIELSSRKNRVQLSAEEAAYLKRIFREHHIPQRTLAEITGVAQNTLSKYFGAPKSATASGIPLGVASALHHYLTSLHVVAPDELAFLLGVNEPSLPGLEERTTVLGKRTTADYSVKEGTGVRRPRGRAPRVIPAEVPSALPEKATPAISYPTPVTSRPTPVTAYLYGTGQAYGASQGTLGDLFSRMAAGIQELTGLEAKIQQTLAAKAAEVKAPRLSFINLLFQLLGEEDFFRLYSSGYQDNDTKPVVLQDNTSNASIGTYFTLFLYRETAAYQAMTLEYNSGGNEHSGFLLLSPKSSHRVYLYAYKNVGIPKYAHHQTVALAEGITVEYVPYYTFKIGLLSPETLSNLGHKSYPSHRYMSEYDPDDFTRFTGLFTDYTKQQLAFRDRRLDEKRRELDAAQRAALGENASVQLLLAQVSAMIGDKPVVRT